MSQFDLANLQHILGTMRLVETYLDHVSEGEYTSDPILQEGMIRLLDFISETSRHISDDLKEEHPAFPWQDLSDLNNRGSASAAGVDKAETWVTASDRIPELRKKVQSMVEDLKNGQP